MIVGLESKYDSDDDDEGGVNNITVRSFSIGWRCICLTNALTSEDATCARLIYASGLVHQ